MICIVARLLTSQYNQNQNNYNKNEGLRMLLRISRYIDAFNNRMGKIIAYGTLLMALITFAIVVLRYGFNLGWIAMQESVTYLHAAVFLLCSAYTYQHNGHVRVDIFYRSMNARKQTIVNLIGCILFLLPVSLYITFICWHYVAESWQVLESSREPGGLPFVYLLKSILLIFSISMTLQAISEIIKHGLRLSNNDDSHELTTTDSADKQGTS
jgi:TRAP-type mannitol/chloroaromatic compound transport system permease small subunit